MTTKAKKMSVAITGVWVRSDHDGNVVVLVEADGKFRRVFKQASSDFQDGEVSHIVETMGIMKSPVDDL